jgi:hypothetical protein
MQSPFVFRRCGGRGNRDWSRMHDEELHDLYSSLHIIRVIKSRTVAWAGHVARMVEFHTGF